MKKNRQRIVAPRQNSLNDNDRTELATLLLKAGYCVKKGSEKQGNKTVYYVEFWVEEE